LHCPPCERIHCSTRRALKLQCKGGVTTGVCGCCPVCARTEGETCGGAWDYLGKCDEGLVCVYQDEGEEKAGREKEGTLVSLEKKSCQGSCQHVSCSSCLLIKPPPCPHTCSASDSTCLQRFGKCVHHHLSHSPVCHNNLQSNPEGHFLCLVPDCQSTSK
uniref:Si:ch73-330k17.3 n=1 Tax=Cynoglossus semilaevis TaxID=244447 RepID=A0A3P8W0P7_CYNSE